MKVREVLGVDFAADRLLAVQLRQGPAGTVLTHAAQRDMPAVLDTSSLAALLRQMLQEHGFTAASAVFGLPSGQGFLQCLEPGVDASRALPATDYATGAWRSGDGHVIRAVAARGDVDRLRQIAVQASLDLQVVNLRSLGCLTALGYAHRPAGSGARIGIVVGDRIVTLVLLAEGKVQAAYTRGFQTEAAGGLERYIAAAKIVEQMVRLATTAHPASAPQKVRLIVNRDDEEMSRLLPDRLGMAVETVVPGQEFGLRLAKGTEKIRSGDFAAAIGLAIQGLQSAQKTPERDAGAESVNLLQSQAEAPGSRLPSWKKLLASAGVAAALLLGALLVQGIRKHRHVGRLRRELAARSESDASNRAVLARWRAIREWVSPSEDGLRPASRTALDAIAEIFPPTDRAHVSRLTLTRQPDSPVMSARLEGRADGTDPLYEFVAQLNNSKSFEHGRLGPISEDEGAARFNQRFSVTFRLKR